MNVIIRQVENGWIIEHQPGHGRTTRSYVATNPSDIVKIVKLIMMVVDDDDLSEHEEK